MFKVFIEIDKANVANGLVLIGCYDNLEDAINHAACVDKMVGEKPMAVVYDTERTETVYPTPVPRAYCGTA